MAPMVGGVKAVASTARDGSASRPGSKTLKGDAYFFGFGAGAMAAKEVKGTAGFDGSGLGVNPIAPVEPFSVIFTSENEEVSTISEYCGYLAIIFLVRSSSEKSS